MNSLKTIDLLKNIDKEVSFFGWVDEHRDHGKIFFLDIKDRYGLVQVVSKEKDLKVQKGTLVLVKGLVKKRPDNLIN